jgi:hypothetical protein
MQKSFVLALLGRPGRTRRAAAIVGATAMD